MAYPVFYLPSFMIYFAFIFIVNNHDNLRNQTRQILLSSCDPRESLVWQTGTSDCFSVATAPAIYRGGQNAKSVPSILTPYHCGSSVCFKIWIFINLKFIFGYSAQYILNFIFIWSKFSHCFCYYSNWWFERHFLLHQFSIYESRCF